MAPAPSRGRRSEPANTAFSGRKLVHLDELELRNRKDDELRYAHAGLDDERLAYIGVEQDDAELAAVAGVDEPRQLTTVRP